MVDLYKVVDKQKFQDAQNTQTHSVKFASVTTVQEYDTESGQLRNEITTVDSPSPPPEEDNSVSSGSSESSTASGNSQASVQSSDSSSSGSSSGATSTSSNSAPPPVKEKKTTSSKRTTSITQETLTQAKEIMNTANANESDGNGPRSDV